MYFGVGHQCAHPIAHRLNSNTQGVLPKAVQMTSVAQEIGWNLDATLSALAVNTNDAMFDGVRESGSGARLTSIALNEDEDDDSGFGIEMSTVNVPSLQQSMSRHDTASSAVGDMAIGRRQGMHSGRGMLSYEAKEHVELLEVKLVNLDETLRDTRAKVNQICEYAVKHMNNQSMLSTATKAIYRMVEDCTDRGTGRTNTGPAPNGSRGLGVSGRVNRNRLGSGHGQYSRIQRANSASHGDLT
jgi:hypothetical protein